MLVTNRDGCPWNNRGSRLANAVVAWMMGDNSMTLGEELGSCAHCLPRGSASTASTGKPHGRRLRLKARQGGLALELREPDAWILFRYDGEWTDSCDPDQLVPLMDCFRNQRAHDARAYPPELWNHDDR